MPALWVEITEAVTIGGVKALQIAFYDVRQLPDIMRVLRANEESPGAASELLLSARARDTKGRSRVVLKEESTAAALFHRYTLSCRDLSRGMTKKQMAELAGMSVYDTRLRPLCKDISIAAFKAWGMEPGWYKGRYRVLTANQSTEKETKLLKYNVRGGIKRAEKKRAIADNKALPPSATETHTLTLFEGIVGEEND